MNVRFATAADIPVMLRVINSAFVVEKFLEGDRANAPLMVKRMKDGVFFVAEDDGELVGAIYTEFDAARSYFGMLAVSPARQGSGVARQLIEAAENYGRENKCKFMDITVLSLRPELPNFYAQFGYRVSGTKEFNPDLGNKSHAPCHCICMEKAL